MKRISTLITMIALLPGLMTAARVNGRLGMDNVDIHKTGDRLQVNLNLILDSLNMKGQNQFFVTTWLRRWNATTAGLSPCLTAARSPSSRGCWARTPASSWT